MTHLIEEIQPQGLSYEASTLPLFDTTLDALQQTYDAHAAFAQKHPQQSLLAPLPPRVGYLDREEWGHTLSPLPQVCFSTFNASDKAPLARPLAPFSKTADHLYSKLAMEIRTLLKNRKVLICAQTEGSTERLAHIFNEQGFDSREIKCFQDLETLPLATLAFATLPLHRGFQTDDSCVVTEEDLLGEKLLQQRTPSTRQKHKTFRENQGFEIGDYVVHRDHGIGQYQGLESVKVDQVIHECLLMVYAEGDKIFIPIENLDLVTRYGSSHAEVTLDKLGLSTWQHRRARIKEKLVLIAKDLIQTAAERSLKQGNVMHDTTDAFEAFAAHFPHVETQDQSEAIQATLTDLRSGQLMDRLICGDVGFGKTEVALRAAYQAILAGYQVALVVPTTLLARQHMQTCEKRFHGTGVRLGQLSRLVPPKETKATKAALKEGTVDLVVATHAILASDVAFKKLGLLIIDEEQQFGVKQKEHLKKLKEGVHVLTLTATPIPRTLQMSLSGVREMSLITTPPVNRFAVQTYITPWDDALIHDVVMREKNRGGQTFLVCPRIENLERVHQRLLDAVPDVRTTVVHGRLSPRAIEDAMMRFGQGLFDVLISTNIIESGIDVQTANTLLVHQPHLFGLSQLYQLRGRVGRHIQQGYAYFLLPEKQTLSPHATRRLEILSSLDYLGAGFALASHDMDLRGPGSLVGEEQSGHIREVGVELYQEMLLEAVEELKSKKEGSQPLPNKFLWTPQIKVPFSIRIPETYVEDLGLRLNLYKRLSALESSQEIEALGAELVDRFGPLPQDLENLLHVLSLKLLCRKAHIDTLTLGPKGAHLALYQGTFPYPGELLGWISSQQTPVRVCADQRLFFSHPFGQGTKHLRPLKAFLEDMGRIAQGKTPLGDAD